MDSDPSTPRVHVVNDIGGSLVVRSSPIQRESERALYLQEALIPIGGYYPKRLFVKGVDLLAYNEEMALRLYLHQIEGRLADMERVVADFRQRQQEGEARLRSLSERRTV